jgi:hypothetical protein
MPEKALNSWCNSCGRETQHDEVHREFLKEFEYPDADADERLVVVRCRGCKDLAIRHENWWFDRTPDESNEGAKLTHLSYNPPRTWRRPPEWLVQLDQIAPELKELLDEVYSAANDRQFRLLAMGVRAVVDTAMVQIVGDIGGFKKKLDQMVAKGHLTQRQSDILETVIDAGSAAAHRGFKPPQELLQEMLTTMETIVRDYYLTGPMLKAMKTLIPPRPPRKAP